MPASYPPPPENTELAEAALLGSLLLHYEAGATLRSLLQTEDFTTNRHRLIYEAILAAVDASEPDAVNTVKTLLTERELEDIGGVSSLMALQQQARSVELSIEQQVYLLKRESLHRQLIQAREGIFNQGVLDDDLTQLVHDLERVLSLARQMLSPDHALLPEIVPGREALGGYLAGPNSNAKGDLLTGVPTGFIDLDVLTGGLQPSDLIIAAGPPSVGKTAFALSITLHVLKTADASVGLFSLEASRRQLVQRLLAMEANLDQRKFRTIEIDGGRRDQLREADEAVSDGKLWIDDTASLSTAQLRDRASFLVKHCEVRLLIVDYVHLMLSSVNDKRHENRVQEVGEISRSLKELARARTRHPRARPGATVTGL